MKSRQGDQSQVPISVCLWNASSAIFDVRRVKGEVIARQKRDKSLMDSLDKTNVRWRKLLVKSLLAGNGVLIFGGHTRFSSCIERNTYAYARMCTHVFGSIDTHTYEYDGITKHMRLCA